MAIPFLNEIQKEFIRKNYKVMSGNKMATDFGCSKSVIYFFRKQEGLILTKEESAKFRGEGRVGFTTFTKEEDAFIKENYLSVPVKTLATLLNRSGVGVIGRLNALKLVIPAEIIEERKQQQRFKKGQVPINKGLKQTDFMTPEAIEKTKATRFQKGQKPKNTMEIGKITTRGYGGSSKRNPLYRLKFIKIGPGGLEWLPLHIYNWLESGEEIPEGFMVSFKTPDYLNADKSNLQLITMEENMKRNWIHNYPEELKEIMLLKGAITRQINKIKK